jgi:ABC-type uncharacterized transport system involved in gliding motility auxiliary subunit
MSADMKQRLTSRQAKYGLNTAIYTLVAVAIVVVVNLIANRYVKQVDLTANQRYTLSPQTGQILADLQTDVEFLYFDRRANFGNVEDRLAMYPTRSNHVKVTYVDPDRERGLAEQHNIRSYGTLVIAAAGRNEQVTNITEEDITNAVIKVLKGGPKKIYFLTGHGERDIDSTERLGYSAAKTALTESNYTVETLSLLQENPRIPDDCTLLVVAGTQNDPLDPEIAAIKDYIVGGGRVFFLLHPHSPPKLVALLAEFGADAKNSLVVDTSGIGRLFGTDELMPLAVQYDDHPVTKDMTNIATLFPFSASVNSAPSGMPGATFQAIARTTDKSWSTTEVQSREVSFQEGRDTQGPVALFGAGTFQKPEGAPDAPGAANTPATPGAEGRFIVAGSTEFPANAIIGFNGNRDLFVNAVNWLASDEDLISIRPKEMEDRRVDLQPGQMTMIFYLLVAVPAIVVLGGLGVWWKRRG